MTYRIEIYRPHPDACATFRCSGGTTGEVDGGGCNAIAHLMDAMRGSRPGTFALVIRIDGDEETVLERWRVDAEGRVLRAVYDVRERELEQTTYPTETQRAFFAPYRPPAASEHCACGFSADQHPHHGCQAFIATW